MRQCHEIFNIWFFHETNFPRSISSFPEPCCFLAIFDGKPNSPLCRQMGSVVLPTPQSRLQENLPKKHFIGRF